MEVAKVIAHRGASAYAPENTIVAFEKAKILGAQVIEFDVMLSSNGQAFVFHDDNLKRTTNGRGELGLVEAAYIQTLDAGKWFAKKFAGEKIPTLHEAINWLNANNMQANIEIKPYKGATQQTTLAVLEHINRYWPKDKPLPRVSSFDNNALKLCHEILPDLPLGMLLDKFNNNWLSLAQSLGCSSIHCNYRILTKQWVTEMKQQGYLVYAYTVNRKRRARKLFAWGVDCVFSDYPDLL